MFELQQLSSGRYGTSGASSLPLASVYTSRRVSGESGSVIPVILNGFTSVSRTVPDVTC
ncbi:hypothetical protein FOWG_00960 [Fusarium oxysporum f. sp. lycopersici MN25]|nr:hypothetical protein FOWG_00960 [Fusarium oxysporum f. sp. lycopersici MN25]